MTQKAEHILGYCSDCGGRVVTPTVSWTLEQAMPKCEECGGEPDPDGRIQMRRKTDGPSVHDPRS